MMKYLQVTAIIALISMAFVIKQLIGTQALLKFEISQLEAEDKLKDENMKLLVIQLDREAEYRMIAESALSALYKDVPDDEYKTTLPPNIQNVLDNFHSSIRTGNP